MDEIKTKDLMEGDLFFISDSSELSQAIKGIDLGSRFSHVGIFFDKMIYHADFKKGVIKQNLGLFLKDTEKEIFIFRCPLISNFPDIKNHAEKFLGLPYNYSFYPDGKGLYCSQFIAKILPVFKTVPMKFGDGKKEISDYWKKYYEELGVPVPLNLEGTNPSQISQSENLVFIGKLIK